MMIYISAMTKKTPDIVRGIFQQEVLKNGILSISFSQDTVQKRSYTCITS